MKILTAEQMRQIDRACIQGGTPASTLMENAGRAVAEETRNSLGDIEEQRILCLVGPGNNGGDGLVAARYLRDWGAEVSVCLCSPRPEDDKNLQLVREREITCLDVTEESGLEAFDKPLASATCVIDALLGTGRLRPLEGVFRQVLEKVAAARQGRRISVIAVDLPSGLDADSGEADPACLQAETTVTLAMPKLGLFAFPGAAKVGTLKIADIGIPGSLGDAVMTELVTSGLAKEMLPERPRDGNKGSFGRALVSAGSLNYIGAAYLACSGAMRTGAGLVTLATPASLQPILASKLTEATYLPLPEAEPGSIDAGAAEILAKESGHYDVLLVGCGMGQSLSARDYIHALLGEEMLPPLVLDADAINILAETRYWWQALTDDVILTPHPGEMARLCGLPVEEVQSRRLNIARRFAAEWHKTIVLKGAHTVIAAPDGHCRISPFANPGLASAGTGDVLAGIITGLVAQGLSLFNATSLGVYLHGEAAEMIKNMLGDAGMIATDLLPALPVVIKQLKNTD